MKRHEIILLLLLALVQFTGIVDFMILMPLKPKLTDIWGINPQQFGIAVFAFGLGAFLSSLYFVNKVDNYDRKKVLAFVYGGFTLGTFFCGLATNYEMLVLARFLTGIFGGICGSVIQSIVGDAIAAERRGQAMGILMMGFALASVLGVPGGLYLAGHFSWFTPFLVLGALCALVFVGILFFIPSFTEHLSRVKKQGFFEIMKVVLSDSNRRWALLLTFFMMPSHFFIIPFLTDFFTKNLGFDYATTVPFVYVAGGLLTVVSSPIVGKLSDRLGRYPVLLVLSVLTLIPMLVIPNLHTTSKLVLLAASSSLFIFSGSRMIISMAHVTSTVEPKLRGAFLIVNSSVQQLATSLASLISGFIVYAQIDGKLINYPYLGYLAIVFVALALLTFRKVHASEG
jgi:MFS transporter, DHA1 family, inner membrane transport protein